MNKIFVKDKPGIYCILMLSSRKYYVGSSKAVYYRVARHYSDLKYGRHPNKHLQNSINKNGLDNFLAFGIEYCEDDKLLDREMFWMNTLKPQLNITWEIYRNTLSPESRKLGSDTLKQRYKDGLKAYRQDHAWVTVYQYSLEGDYIRSYDCIMDACRDTGLYKSAIQNASSNCSGRAGKYQWRRLRVEKLGPVSEFNGRYVTLVDKSGNKQLFYSIRSAAAYLGIGSMGIHKRIKQGYYKDYKIIPGPTIKLGELLEHPSLNTH